MKRALFLDRDGVLDELVYYEWPDGEWEAPRTVGDIRMVEGTDAPLQRFLAAGWLLFIVTNQPDHAKGKVALESLQEVHAEIVRRLGVPIARSYVCFHRAEDRCMCRKPSPFSLHEAAREFGVDLAESWMIGDQDSDLACGRAAGCRVALIEHRGSEHKRGSIEPDLRVNDLAEFAQTLLGNAGVPAG